MYIVRYTDGILQGTDDGLLHCEIVYCIARYKTAPGDEIWCYLLHRLILVDGLLLVDCVNFLNGWHGSGLHHLCGVDATTRRLIGCRRCTGGG